MTMAGRKPLFVELVTSAMQGAKRASADTRLEAERDAPSKGDVDNMVATGKAIIAERPMTEDERRRILTAYTFGRFLGRWLTALAVGAALFGGGLFLFSQFVVPEGADSPLNPMSWLGMIGGGATLIGCVVYAPVIVYKVLGARRDAQQAKVKQVIGVLMKYAKPPARYWIVGDRRFDIVDAAFWDMYADGETITIDLLPRNADILKVHSRNGTLDVLAREGH
jgi:hypothetical protein